MKNIDVAHSPDADDIFMYAAMEFGWVSSPNLQFSSVTADIETLNQEALKGTFSTTAISFGLYPLIWEEYALLRTAVSFGNGYGPKLIKKKNTTLDPNFKVALSGKYTTNAMLFKIAYPNARVVYKNFLEIEGAVLSGEVDAGVLIHESILNFNPTLCVEREIWDVWCELRGDLNLPLPLGGMAVRRSLTLNTAIEIESLLTKAVEISQSNKKEISQMLLERNLVRVDEKYLETYLNLYANADSISMSEIQINAIDKLFEIGFKNGFYNSLVKTSSSMIPTEYLESRNS